MRFLHSIRWRLQLWHGLLLALVLAGFGFTAWHWQRATLLQSVDQELERRIAIVGGAMRRGSGAPGRLPPDRPPRPLDPPEIRLSAHETSFFEPGPDGGYYYVAWLPRGREIARAPASPAAVPRPERTSEHHDVRMRETLREAFHFTPSGECLLVGRDIGEELANIRRYAWILSGAGFVVLLLGLAGGGWISARALKPIQAITATAARISTGDLAQRIQTRDTSSELGDLARVLNETFARLQASFARQAQFTADASHELRTPLSVLLTQTQSALARERSAAEYRESLAACQRAAQRMRRLTDSLLTLARLDSGEDGAAKESCELNRVAHEAVELLQPIATGRGIRLQTDLAPVQYTGNAGQLSQVVTNLVSNALEYNRPGGSVQVRLTAEPGAALLEVSDTGQGIAPEDLPHIFERFYRADKARSNAAGHCGLGLAITKAIVEAHGGSIDVKSEPSQGSTFTVRLPFTAPPAP